MASPSARSDIRQAASISSVLACSELIAVSSADQLSVFIRSLIIRDAAFAVTERAVKLAEEMNKLTVVLLANWEQTYLDQGRGRILQPGGSIMWSPQWGWQILPRSPAQSYCGDSINLEIAAKENGDIRLALDAMWEAMRTSAPSPENILVE